MSILQLLQIEQHHMVLILPYTFDVIEPIVWIITPLIDHHYSSTHLLNRHLFSRHLTQGTERAVLQAPRQTLGVERVRARQPAGAGRVHRGHAGAAGRVTVIVWQVHGAPTAPGCSRLGVVAAVRGRAAPLTPTAIAIAATAPAGTAARTCTRRPQHCST